MFEVRIGFRSPEEATEMFCEFQNLSKGLKNATKPGHEGADLQYFAGAGVMMINELRKRINNLDEFMPGPDSETGKP